MGHTNDFIKIKGAKEHNLKNIDLDIPRNSLTVITGLSGSGKSSLAFDTIYAEGQRRYIESLSSYARQFLDQLKKPDVEAIEGLTPTIAIEQRTGKATPRSTVATTTEIYDYLRVFFARVGDPYCYICDKPISSQSPEDVVNKLMALPEQTKIQILAPLIRGKKGEHKDIVKHLIKEGFSKLRLNGEIFNAEDFPVIDKNKAHSMEAVVDRIRLKDDSRTRLTDAVEISMRLADGMVMVITESQDKTVTEDVYSEKFACPDHGGVLEEMNPRIFSFNSPFGACTKCSGLGTLIYPSPELIIPSPQLSLEDGALYAWKRCGSGLRAFYPNSVKYLCSIFNISIKTPWNKIPKEKADAILYGTKKTKEYDSYEGIIPNLIRRFMTSESEQQKARIHEFMSNQECDGCKGDRLKPQSLAVKINGKNIANISAMAINEAVDFIGNLNFSEEKQHISTEIIKAIKERLSFLTNVGLNYLTLNRLTRTLSGGEAQRIRLAGQLGAKLSGVTYVLDEPTIGLHQHDNRRLIKTLQSLRELGNTLVVVEHDEDVIRSADYLIDMGPGAGEFGGYPVAFGDYKTFIKCQSLTARYLNKEIEIELPKKRRKPVRSKQIVIDKCRENNLKNITVGFPLGLFICVTGVSGSGKSTLINDCLLKGMQRDKGNLKIRPGKFETIKGIQHIDKIIDIDQSPIGRTPRSNPVTYIGVFDEIRKLFSMTQESKARGYKPGRFSFNVKGGRCQACEGQGEKIIEMHFLPDVHVTCETCLGRRYNSDTLDIKYKGKNIADVLSMSISEAVEFFSNFPRIYNGLKTLDDTGLGYIRLGQASTTLSGGEAQRIKLAAELSKVSTGKTIYILDEPTTGLHFQDISRLISVIQRLADAGNTLIVIEHNLDIIKCADYIIDMGPEGGDKGGEVIVSGTPEEIVKSNLGLTTEYLKKMLNH